MMIDNKRRRIMAWGWFGAIVVLNSIGVMLSRQSQQAYADWFEFIFPTMLIACALVGALIISRQPRNLTGVLLFLPGSSFAPFTDGVADMFTTGLWAIPQPPTLLYFLFVWFAGWNWVLLIFPLLYLLVLFPTGRPLSPRWRWLLYYITFIMLVIPGFSTFGEYLDANGREALAVANPIGFITLDWANENIMPFFLVLLPVCVILCVVALFVCFRRARGVERDQIKWLFLAGAVFAATYVSNFLGGNFIIIGNIGDVLWMFGMLLIPIAIGIAILRYRLFDIDLIIRRTVQYGVVTALLGVFTSARSSFCKLLWGGQRGSSRHWSSFCPLC